MTVGRIVDVSAAQHPNNTPIDWPTVKNNGVTTALLKATQGTTYLNPWFHLDLLGATKAGIDVLAYHFADFGDTTAEAEFFTSEAGTLAAVGDFETSTDVAWMRTFLQALGRPADKCVGYGSQSTFVSVYQQIPALPWVAAYGQLYPGWGVMWQFTDAAQIPGIPAAVDESRWYGSQIQYDVLFGVYDPVPPPIDPEDIVYAFENSKGQTVIVGNQQSNGHTVVVTSGADQHVAGGWSLADVTDAIAAAYPGTVVVVE